MPIFATSGSAGHTIMRIPKIVTIEAAVATFSQFQKHLAKAFCYLYTSNKV
jgi:hypothetical protein